MAEAEEVEEDVVVVVVAVVVGDDGGDKAANTRQRRGGATLGAMAPNPILTLTSVRRAALAAPLWLNNRRFGVAAPAGFVVVIVLEGQGLGAAFERKDQVDQDCDDYKAHWLIRRVGYMPNAPM